MDESLKANKQTLGWSDRLIPHTQASFTGMHIWVSQIDGGLAADGLDQDQLRFVVNRRLLQAGLSVPHQHTWQQTPRFPCLGILVHADQAQVLPPFYVFSIEVFYVQKLSTTKSQAANAMCMTWCREAVGEVCGDGRGFDWSSLYNTLGSLVDQFLEESLGLSISGVPARACN